LAGGGADVSSHPLGEVRRNAEFPPEINLRTVQELRGRVNPLIATLTSPTSSRVAFGESGSEWRSAHLMAVSRRKHIRSDLAPIQKYQHNALASHSIGWHVDRGDTSPKRSPHGLRESPMQKWKIDLQDKKVVSTLRVCA
jgi:hypothetical protein